MMNPSVPVPVAKPRRLAASAAPYLAENCVVAGNVATFVCGGIFCGEGADVVNCTVVSNAAGQDVGGILCSSNVTVRNSIIRGNTTPDYSNQTDLCHFSYCCAVPLVPGIGNITNDPRLTPAYRLRSISPCIDAGTAADAPATDMDGEARWDDPRHSNVVSIVDIGADEFVDTDLDSMADCWETNYWGNITYQGATGDADADGLNNRREYRFGACPTNSDTDADQMPDGWEVAHLLDPRASDAALDTDRDGLNNGGEYAADTAPRDPKSLLALPGIRLDWKGGHAAWQFLERREDLASTSERWTAILAVPPPTPVSNAVIHLGATNPLLFYRLRAER